MWKIHRYYLKEVTVSSLLAFTVLFGIVLVSLVYRGLDRAQGFGLLAAAKTTLLLAADMLPHLMAISFLIATVLTYARASQDREITALRAAGISPRVALAPALIVGIVCSLVGAYAQHYVIPYVHFVKYRVVAEDLRQVMQSTGWTDDKMQLGGLVMTWDGVDAQRARKNVYIKLKRETGEALDLEDLSAGGIFRAESAAFAVSGEKLVLSLNGLHKAGTDVYSGSVTLGVDLRAIAESGRRDEGDRDMTSDQLLAEVYRGVHDNPHGAWFTIHQRGCYALLPFLFAPLGFAIGVLARERGRVLALVFAMAPLAAFYVADVVAAKFVRVVDWPLLGWLPALVLFVGGLPFCWRLLRV